MRSGFTNLNSLPAYAQVNVGVSRDFQLTPSSKPFTLRVDVINPFDSIYQIRDGSGSGVFAVQYWPRRGFFLGLSQKI